MHGHGAPFERLRTVLGPSRLVYERRHELRVRRIWLLRQRMRRTKARRRVLRRRTDTNGRVRTGNVVPLLGDRVSVRRLDAADGGREATSAPRDHHRPTPCRQHPGTSPDVPAQRGVRHSAQTRADFRVREEVIANRHAQTGRHIHRVHDRHAGKRGAEKENGCRGRRRGGNDKSTNRKQREIVDVRDERREQTEGNRNVMTRHLAR